MESIKITCVYTRHVTFWVLAFINPETNEEIGVEIKMQVEVPSIGAIMKYCLHENSD